MIMAPNAEVVVGQSGKNFYGAIYAKAIVVHQNANFAWGRLCGRRQELPLQRHFVHIRIMSWIS